jgi:predicted ester cyclase
MEPTQFVSEGDLVVAWVRMKGTQTAEFMGIPASGKELDLELVDMVRVRDGKIVEHWGVSDSLAMMQQLGAAPPPPG